MLASSGGGAPGRVFGTRELAIERVPSIVPYRVGWDDVEILRVFHTSRRPPEGWCGGAMSHTPHNTK